MLKQDPGNGGSGVWKVEPTAPVAKGLAAFAVDARVRVRHAKRGSVEEELTPGAYMQRWERAGADTYVLCEINVSSVFPFPDDALRPLAAERLQARQ